MPMKVLYGTAVAPQRNAVSSPNSDSKSKRHSPTRKKSGKDKSGTTKHSIFVAEPRQQKEIASDVIRADCMNHGYRLDKSIGEGAYAKVKLAEVLPAKLARNQTLADIAEETGNLQVAIKVIDNRRVPKEFLKKFLPRELANHVPLAPHRNVARVFEQFRTTERVYVVMEYCSKGDLLDLINKRIGENHRGVGEDRARAMFRQMCEGVQHIHNNGIVHRDLKCENILIGENDEIKITDFGFSIKFNEKASLLRTSCGSYAYTAPEVIKSRPYDGFKSDSWSLGIILFAMLNGRLPFNDSQLLEMEEDMKMQRLRFERFVSFDAMVLVRRVLQYNPAQRPTVHEILNDPWLTGKMMIPRQINRPKWINPYEAKTEEIHLDGVTLVGTNPVYYKATVQERGQDATVTVKHDNNETVVLKSRTCPRKNIWTSGPTIYQNRPNTWPKTEKANQQTERRSQDRASRKSRSHGRNASTNTTVFVKLPTKSNRKDGNAPSEPRERVSSKTTSVSKRFMEKYTKEKEANLIPKKNSCDSCIGEADLEKLSTLTKPVQKTVPVGKHCKPAKYCHNEIHYDELENDAVGLNDLQNKEHDTVDVNDTNSELEQAKQPMFEMKTKQKPEVTKLDYRPSGKTRFWGTSDICNRSSSPEVRQKAKTKSASMQGGTARQSGKGSDPPVSRLQDFSKKGNWDYIANRSTNPGERVKYFRQRLMKFYKQDSARIDEREGLPLLTVQAIKPPPGNAKKVELCRNSAVSPELKDNVAWRASSTKGRHNQANGKPFQRVVIHSAL